jgi:hypothetical protein
MPGPNKSRLANEGVNLSTDSHVSEFGNIWRYRNEGVEAYNKVLSKRANMFNSCGNRGNESG